MDSSQIDAVRTEVPAMGFSTGRQHSNNGKKGEANGARVTVAVYSGAQCKT